MYNIKGTSKRVTKTNATRLFAAHSADSVRGSDKEPSVSKGGVFSKCRLFHCTILLNYNISYLICK
jgi:hypothetical protein